MFSEGNCTEIMKDLVDYGCLVFIPVGLFCGTYHPILL